jgi:hypothetical protein
MKQPNGVVLEHSTNTHVIPTEGVEVVKEIPKMTTVVLKTKSAIIVEHGHHNTVATEESTNDVIKITQQEFNPVLNAFQNSFD